MPRGLPPRKPTRYNYSNRDFCPRARVHLIGNRPITTDYARNGMKSRLSEMISRSIDRTDHFSPSHWPLSISVSCSPGRGNLFYSALCRVCPVALFMQFFFFFFWNALDDFISVLKNLCFTRLCVSSNRKSLPDSGNRSLAGVSKIFFFELYRQFFSQCFLSPLIVMIT